MEGVINKMIFHKTVKGFLTVLLLLLIVQNVSAHDIDCSYYEPLEIYSISVPNSQAFNVSCRGDNCTNLIWFKETRVSDEQCLIYKTAGSATYSWKWFDTCSIADMISLPVEKYVIDGELCEPQYSGYKEAVSIKSSLDVSTMSCRSENGGYPFAGAVGIVRDSHLCVDGITIDSGTIFYPGICMYRLEDYCSRLIECDEEWGGCCEGNCCTNTSIGSSANYSSGNLYDTRDIISLSGTGLTASLSLSYNSLDNTVGPLGRGWTHNYNMSVSTYSTNSQILIEEDGRRMYFKDDGSGIYRPASITGDYSTITLNSGLYELIKKDRMIYRFDSVLGKLLSITDRNNNSISLIYTNNMLSSIVDQSGRTIHITYDIEGKIISITDPANRETRMTYDANGNLATITGPDGSNWNYSYDSEGKMLSKTDPRRYITTYSYDWKGRVITSINPEGTKTILYGQTGSYGVTVTERDGGVWTYKYDIMLSVPLEVTDPNGAKKTYVYDDNRNLISETDAKGNTTTYTHDNNGNMTSMTDPMGNVTTYIYDEFSQITSIRDPQGHLTAYAYDANGNLISITDPSGIGTQYQYDLRGNVISINNAGKISTLAYDQYNNLVSITDLTGATTSYTYDISGNMTSQTDAMGNTTTFEYNISNQVVRTSDPQGNITTYTYDAIGNRTSTTDANGNVTSYEYNHNNHPVTVVDALGNTTTYSYGSGGCPLCSGGADKLTSVTDANNHTIFYDYDLAGRLIQMTDQLGNIETHTYDSNNNLIAVTDRKGQTTTYTYDSLNQMIQATYADGSFTTYVYDTTGRVTIITDSISGTISYTYSTADSGMPLGKVINETTPLGSISYTYDAWGRRTSMTIVGQLAVNYTYDDNGRLTGIDTLMNGATSYFSIQYDALGRRTSLMLPNGATANFGYDNLSNLLNLQHLNPLQTVLESIGYTYDPVGNRLSMDRPSVNLPRPNPASNITYNTANQMLTFNAENITYDANGNMTAVTNFCGTTTYTWDVRNRLIGISGFDTQCSPLSASFKYDALGRRIEKIVNGRTIRYLYDGSDIFQEIENGTVTVNYIRTLNIDEPLARVESDGTVRYYQTDALGSVIALTDETGVTTTRYAYTAFGSVTISGEISDNPFQYTGRENDGTGLYYYRARYYSPELQRFISEDPLRLKSGDINFFVYVKNNPIKFTDPKGLACGSNLTDWVIPDKFFDYDFTICCEKHDKCYGCYGATLGKSKDDCDNEFCDCLHSVCEKLNGEARSSCEINANGYCAAVKIVGGKAFKNARKCCNLGSGAW